MGRDAGLSNHRESKDSVGSDEAKMEQGTREMAREVSATYTYKSLCQVRLDLMYRHNLMYRIVKELMCYH